jgi:hypothetical protein
MPFKRRVFCSLSHPDQLDDRRAKLQEKIVEHVVGLDLQPEIFLFAGTAAGMAWSLRNAIDVMRQCVGAVVLAFPRWTVSQEDGELHLPSEFAQIEGAIATTVGLPLLLISEQGLADRGVIWTGAGHPILFMPSGADTSWLASDAFLRRFRLWSDQIAERSDVFLGYSSKARSLAQAVHLFLTERLRLKVRNWEIDFSAAGIILDEIETAARLCTGGVFVFTKDDALEGNEGRAAPRDNVVFEAGYFAAAKGRDRVLIIREEGAKMPADLGGNIYLPISDRNDIRPIESAIRDFVERRL